MAQKNSDVKKIKELIAIMKENNLVEIEIKHGDDKIFLKRSDGSAPKAQIASVPMMGAAIPATGAAGVEVQPTALDEEVRQGAEQDGEELVEIKSPIVGTFYATPSPDSDVYVEVGSEVTPTTVVCIIEAMKVMNEIKAEVGGTIVEVVAENGQAVEYGQVLFKVKPE